LPDDGSAVKRNRCANAWDYRIDAFDGFTIVVNARFVADDVHIAALMIDDGHFVAALLAGFHQSTGRVQISVRRKYSDLHIKTSSLVRMCGGEFLDLGFCT
jgi:hypothetical protein